MSGKMIPFFALERANMITSKADLFKEAYPTTKQISAARSCRRFSFAPMRDFAAAFYKSRAWQACRAAYLEQSGGLCESCLARGIYKPAEIVHHIIEISPANINDPAVTLNPANLRAVCRECHAAEHGARIRRYECDELGRVRAKA